MNLIGTEMTVLFVHDVLMSLVNRLEYTQFLLEAIFLSALNVIQELILQEDQTLYQKIQMIQEIVQDKIFKIIFTSFAQILFLSVVAPQNYNR